MTLTEIIQKLRELHMRLGHQATVLVSDDEGEFEPKPVVSIEFDPDFKAIVINYDANYHDPLA